MSPNVRIHLVAIALVLAGCSSGNDLSVAPGTGTLYGTISNGAGALAGASVTVTPVGQHALAAVTTNNAGAYRVAGIDVSLSGSGTVAVSSLTTNCTAPTPVSFTGLRASDSINVSMRVTCTSPTGSLSVVVNAPTGVTPSVTVTGPNGYSKSLSATQNLTGLTPGNYTVSAAAVDLTNAIVASVDTATVKATNENVTAGATLNDTVTYVARPGTGALWVANDASSHAFVGYTAAQLASSGAPAPSLVSSAAAPAGSANAMAFDAHGNLWEIGASANQILEYSAGQLTSGTPVATITLNDVNGVLVNGIAFDAQGNLWIANYGPCDIDELSASQLAASGSVSRTPVLTLNGCASTATVSGPNGLAFDAQGNLWVADVDSSDVYEYPASVLTGTGQITSEPVNQTRPGIAAQYLAFDGGGNLWVSGSNQVVRLTPAQLASGGASSPVSITPSRSVSVTSASFEGVAFDDSGDLWLVDNANAVVAEISATQLANGGAITPATTIASASGSMSAPWSLAFNPHPTGLPNPGPSLARRRK